MKYSCLCGYKPFLVDLSKDPNKSGPFYIVCGRHGCKRRSTKQPTTRRAWQQWNNKIAWIKKKNLENRNLNNNGKSNIDKFHFDRRKKITNSAIIISKIHETMEQERELCSTAREYLLRQLDDPLSLKRINLIKKYIGMEAKALKYKLKTNHIKNIETLLRYCEIFQTIERECKQFESGLRLEAEKWRVAPA